MLEDALLRDTRGAELLQGVRTSSRDWGTVDRFCALTYTPMTIRPLTRGAYPDATLRMMRAGRITFSRFCFGTPTRTDDFDPSSGNIIVVNTIRGKVRHPLTHNDVAETQAGDSYVVNCSRTAYWNVADGTDMQLNLTIPHAVMEETAARWYGFVPDDDLWTKRLVFGHGQTAWLSLIDFAARSFDARGNRILDPVIEARLEEMICIELLRNWAEAAGLRLDTGARSAAPRHVREAERLMQDKAAEAPSIGFIAEQVGVTQRSLSEGFRRFRGITPHEYLTAQRLEGLRRALLEAGRDDTVAGIAGARGYVNLGAMTARYRARFGETPAQTLRRGRTRA